MSARASSNATIPKIVLVKGPLVLNSQSTSVVAAGAVAEAIAPNNSATAQAKAVFSNINVPIMDFTTSLTLANNGDEVFLRTKAGQIIDVVTWGDSDYSGFGWYGKAVLKVSDGFYIQRQGEYWDSNTSADWDSFRSYGLGQSDFPVQGLQTLHA